MPRLPPAVTGWSSRRWPRRSTRWQRSRLQAGDDAELAATLLGAAHSIRGAFDESSLVAPRVRETARLALGDAGFDAAYRRGRDLSKEAAVECADAQVRRR